MNSIKLDLDKNKKYVVACSFGPDSMALLSLAIENGYKIVVAHVNYRKREAAIYEQKSLEQFCNEKNIKIYCLDLLNQKHTGNFQDWARKKRYEFFKKVAREEDAYAVLVAHQQDDVIETYLMQEKRGNIAKNAGIPVENDLFGIKIIRPLLRYSKQDLLSFVERNGIPYSIDQTNLTDAYTRNKIRHNIVEKMTQNEREKVLHEICTKQHQNIDKKTEWKSDEFCELTYEQIVRLLDYYMLKTNTHRDLSKKFIYEIKKAFKSKTNCSFEITQSINLEKDYDDVYLVNLERIKDYEFIFEKTLENELFEIDFSEGATDRNVPATLKSILVRNIDINKQLIIRDYSKTINRVFIDWKMPHFLRKVWPGFYDQNGNLLYVPRYRKKFKDNHKSKLNFKTKYFIEF